ncbi:hypothetical protein EG829_23215, partial [bacterium]|nr:hypothetical protein [bacterium]
METPREQNHGGVQMKTRCIVLFLVSVIAFVSAPPVLRSEEIVITATNFQESSPQAVGSKAPTSFSETLKVNPLANGLITTNDALRLSSGINLPDYGQHYFPAPLSLRGPLYQHTLVMLDGVPLSSSLGDPVDFSLYSISAIDRIEVIRGSNAAAFGSQAMGGVVNIITKNPAARDAFSLTSSQGTYGSSLCNVMLSRGKEDMGVLFNITRSWAENDFMYEKDDGSEQKRQNNDFEKTGLLAKLWLDLDGWDTSLSGSLADHSLGSPGGEGYAGAFLTPSDSAETSQYMLVFNTAKDLDQGKSLALKASRMYTRTNFTSDYNIPPGDSRTNLTSDYAEAAYTGKTGFLTLVPGFSLRREALSSAQYGIHARSTGSGSLGADLDLVPVLIS